MPTFIKYLLLIALAITLTACRKTVTTTTEVTAIPAPALSLDPHDKAWADAPVHPAKLVLQDLVEPRLMQPSTVEVQVQALANGGQIAFRLEWADSTQNDRPGPKHFLDACAVQIPAKIEANAPAPQMGEAGKTVQISYWRSDWQAMLEGRADNIQGLYPNASVDHYPFNAKPLEKNAAAQNEAATRYSPARAMNNRRTGWRESPVEDLIAEGPATLAPAPQSVSKGRGVRTKTGWAVVITRPLPQGLAPNVRTQIAFAVWEGGHGETGARKMRTGWIPLVMK
jgi:DMSO reductase family type II enzyme heme b subunit